MSTQELLRVDRLALRRHGARHVARVLLVEHEQFAEMEIGQVLRGIPYVTRERARRWLAHAAVNPMRLGSELTEQQRQSLITELVIFSRNPSV